MGVSGSGKTSVGERLAEHLGWPFYDGDDFHPPENVAKMTRGEPLDDGDRTGWLAALHDLLATNLAEGRSLILACSALRGKYRDQLKGGLRGVGFVYLRGNYDLILHRMQRRTGHYMKAEMLRSQFEVLEEPEDALIIDIDQKIDTIVDQIIDEIRSQSPENSDGMRSEG
jgi:gluconokinase